MSFYYNQGYFIEYIFDEPFKKAYVKFVVRVTDGFDRCYDVRSNSLCIFDINNNTLSKQFINQCNNDIKSKSLIIYNVKY